jgi:hypothetical protein
MPVVDGRYVAPTSQKQDFLRAVCRQKRFVLANGTRLSTKTVGCCQAVADHAWDVQNANIAIITVTQTVGHDSGVWDDLVKRVLPERVEAGFGMDWVKQDFLEGVSKKPTCIVKNKFGQNVRIQLHSLKNEEEVEARFKGPRFTMIYVPELSTFHKAKTFQTWCECLRVPGKLGMTREEKEKLQIPDDHIFLGDTNPADEGEESWIWRTWFHLLHAEESELDPRELPMRRNLARVDFTLDDNIFDSQERLDLLKAEYASDPDLYDRYILGKWVQATTDAIFYSVFRPNIHVVGEYETRVNPYPEVMVPEENCMELLTGWDLGSSNSAVSIIEPVTREVEVKVPNEDRTRLVPVSHFKQLDENVKIGDSQLVEFVEEVLAKMDFWQQLVERPVIWKHYSDRNVFSVQDLDNQIYLNQRVLDISEGRIALIGAWDAQRGASVERRVGFFRRLLHEMRFFSSCSKCPFTINMIKSMRRPKGQSVGIQKGSVHKHPFDSTTYPVCSVCYDEMMISTINRTSRSNSGESTVIQMAL